MKQKTLPSPNFSQFLTKCGGIYEGFKFCSECAIFIKRGHTRLRRKAKGPPHQFITMSVIK
jgi:hypothetical protein